MPRATLIIALLLATTLTAQDAPSPPKFRITDSAVTLDASQHDGTPPFTYQWYRNGKALPGETKPVLVITDPKATGVFTCLIRNEAGELWWHSFGIGNTTQPGEPDFKLIRKQKS
jgi:hypothetical protein